MTFFKRTLNSAIWAFSSGYAIIIVSFVGNLIMARILLPKDYGVVSLALSALVFVTMFTGFGSQEAIMQCRDENVKDLIPTAYWISILIGMITAILGVILGIFIRPVLGSTISWIIILFACIVPINSLATSHSARLRRELNYRPVALAQIFSVLISFVLGIIGAVLGMGPWAIALRQSSVTVLFWLWIQFSTSFRLERVFNKEAAGWIWDFGIRKMASQISEIMAVMYPNLLIGSYLGESVLGNYNHSYRLSLLGQQFTHGAVSPILMPMFSSLQNVGDKLKYSFERISYWLFRALPMISAIIFLLGEELVVLVYGDKWAAAGRYFEVFFIYFMLLPITALMKEFLIGSGRISPVVKIQWGVFIVGILGATLGIFLEDVFVVIWVLNLSQLITMILMMIAMNQVVKMEWKRLLLAPFVALAVSIIGTWLLEIPAENLAELMLSVVIIGVLYIGILVMLEFRSIKDEMQIMLAAMRKR